MSVERDKERLETILRLIADLDRRLAGMDFVTFSSDSDESSCPASAGGRTDQPDGWGDDWRAGRLGDDAILARLFVLNQSRAGAGGTR